MRCDEYDADKIHCIVRAGMPELDVRPAGRILLKPNAVMAHPEVFPHAFTHKEFLDGVIRATREQSENVREIAVGERSGITAPTRWVFQNAGYPEILKKHKVKAHYFDEVGQVPVKLQGAARLRDTVFIPTCGTG